MFWVAFVLLPSELSWCFPQRLETHFGNNETGNTISGSFLMALGPSVRATEDPLMLGAERRLKIDTRFWQKERRSPPVSRNLEACRRHSSVPRAGRRREHGLRGGRAQRMGAPFPAPTELLAGLSKSQRSQHPRAPSRGNPLSGIRRRGCRCPASQPGLARDSQLPAHGVGSAAKKVALEPAVPCSPAARFWAAGRRLLPARAARNSENCGGRGDVPRAGSEAPQLNQEPPGIVAQHL
ncbi:uncharacterized protein LOC120765674 [Hirundo rustica]|uniref:uncharacterized protein LOC120765674 n=1 Tax=Hirundo rustica TaxID=43150 RepID=UPI001A944146|nr:uncharacterized protein LOC120765674 [Hirundo rustica]